MKIIIEIILLHECGNKIVKLEIDFHFMIIKSDRHKVSVADEFKPTESEPRIFERL